MVLPVPGPPVMILTRLLKASTIACFCSGAKVISFIFWKSVNKVSDSSRKILVDFYQKFFSMQNMLWALRLKVYYKMSQQDILKRLFYVGEEPSADDPICKFACEILPKSIDNFEDWENWRFANLLNPHEDGSVWNVDPMWIEQRIRFGETIKAYKN